MTKYSPEAARRFETWADYNNEVDAEFRYDRDRDPWPVEYFEPGPGVNIEDDIWGDPDPVRLQFLPYGFAQNAARDGDVGNLVACGMAYQGPVTLLAGRVPYAVVKQLLIVRPSTITGVFKVLNDAAGEDSG